MALGQLSAQPIDFSQMDPVAKMMLVALVCESQKVQDYAAGATERIVERFCTDSIPRQKVEAMPAVTLLRPDMQPGGGATTVNVGSGAEFTYKAPDGKTSLNYIPLFNTLMLPHQGLYLLNRRLLRDGINQIDISMDKPNCAWVGIKTNCEVNSF